jgi:hypothetical protein
MTSRFWESSSCVGGLPNWGCDQLATWSMPGRLQGVECGLTTTNVDHRRPIVDAGHGPARESEQGGGGRVGLYAGFCDRGALRYCPGRRPSISAYRCRQALAVYPQARAGPPSNACAGAPKDPILTLLRVGFTEPPRSPGVLVVSYTTVSPLPGRLRGQAVCSLWHCPAGHPGLPLTTTLPCGARTFLGSAPKGTDATARPTRPP